ncbi:MAG: hypothetical protein IKQ41_10730 [Clostridia bacterium]|nr:hypothetical protein [Clostridia bacterium]
MLTAAAFGCLAGAMIAFPREAAEAAWAALGLWARAVVPALGPFMACMLMLCSRVRGGPGLYTLLAWLSGSPGGARLCQGLGLKGKNALRLAAMTGTISPMFFLGTVSGWFGEPQAGRLIFFCHLLGAYLTGLCLPKASFPPNAAPPSPLSLGDALRESGLALCTVALCMMLGSVASRLALCALPSLSQSAAAALQCALEVTAGVERLIGLPLPCRQALVCAACSVGGLSLLMQNAAFWQESDVSPMQLLLLRLLHGGVAFLLCLAGQQLINFFFGRAGL